MGAEAPADSDKELVTQLVAAATVVGGFMMRTAGTCATRIAEDVGGEEEAAAALIEDPGTVGVPANHALAVQEPGVLGGRKEAGRICAVPPSSADGCVKVPLQAQAPSGGFTNRGLLACGEASPAAARSGKRGVKIAVAATGGTGADRYPCTGHAATGMATVAFHAECADCPCHNVRVGLLGCGDCWAGAWCCRQTTCGLRDGLKL
mmetsp:Transcript_69725/g.123410  ORF Transcript_69725/g.123410 Transcript_69725/m.123410 type:complete len:206 (+) Transcript_69725:807-1424(+)